MSILTSLRIKGIRAFHSNPPEIPSRGRSSPIPASGASSLFKAKVGLQQKNNEDIALIIHF
jgi:hypothetical protein